MTICNCNFSKPVEIVNVIFPSVPTPTHLVKNLSTLININITINLINIHTKVIQWTLTKIIGTKKAPEIMWCGDEVETTHDSAVSVHWQLIAVHCLHWQLPALEVVFHSISDFWLNSLDVSPRQSSAHLQSPERCFPPAIIMLVGMSLVVHQCTMVKRATCGDYQF